MYDSPVSFPSRLRLFIKDEVKVKKKWQRSYM